MGGLYLYIPFTSSSLIVSNFGLCGMPKSMPTIHDQFIFFFPPETRVSLMRQGRKMAYKRADHRRQYGTCQLHAGITRATNPYSEFVIHIACPLQQWLYQRTALLRSTCISFHLLGCNANFLTDRFKLGCSFTHTDRNVGYLETQGAQECVLHVTYCYPHHFEHIDIHLSN